VLPPHPLLPLPPPFLDRTPLFLRTKVVVREVDRGKGRRVGRVRKEEEGGGGSRGGWAGRNPRRKNSWHWRREKKKNRKKCKMR